MQTIIRSKIFWLVVAAAIAGAVALAAVLFSRNQNDYIHPKFGPIVEAIYGLGKVKTDRVYEVKLGVIKTVSRIYVREGDTVKKGARLVRFDDDLVISAPFDGTVTFVTPNVKQSIFPQQPVVRIEDLSTKYIEVSLEQQGALRVQPGQDVRVVFESIRGEQLHGKVSALFSRNEEFLAHIDVPLAENVLPGMTADVAIVVGKREKALLVPLSGIIDGRIRLVRDGKRRTVKLKIGSIDGNWAEVVEGDVNTGDQVIVKRMPAPRS